MLDLSARAAVVTGANGNLGRTVVRAFIERGCHVAAPVRHKEKELELRAALGDLVGTPEDPRLIVQVADLADRAGMEAFVEHVMRTWGRLDILANLAGGFAAGSALDQASIDALWEQNVRSTVTATAACVVPMRARGYGRIVTVGSMSALKARKGAAGYAMAKGALVRWTEALAEELKDEGITANCLLPSMIDHPANRARMPKADPHSWVSPDELARIIVFLSSDDSSAITGAAIPVTART